MDEEKIFELMSKMYSEMQKGFNGINERIDRVEKTVIMIENDHGQKLKSLYDGYLLNSEKLDSIEVEVKKHEEFIIHRVK